MDPFCQLRVVRHGTESQMSGFMSILTGLIILSSLRPSVRHFSAITYLALYCNVLYIHIGLQANHY